MATKSGYEVWPRKYATNWRGFNGHRSSRTTEFFLVVDVGSIDSALQTESSSVTSTTEVSVRRPVNYPSASVSGIVTMWRASKPAQRVRAGTSSFATSLAEP